MFETYLIGFGIFLIIYTVFAIKERNGINFDSVDIEDIFITAILWPLSFILIFTGVRVVTKRKRK